MLRLVFLASLSLLSGCSCDGLWGSYEVPCTRGFDCPDGGMVASGVDQAGGVNDAAMSVDGLSSDGDLGASDLGSNRGDLGPLSDLGPPIDIGVSGTDLGVIITNTDLGVKNLGDLGLVAH